MASSPNPNPSITITSEESELASEQLKELISVTENSQKGSGGNPKRKFTEEQTQILKDAFKDNLIPTLPKMAELAAKTNLRLSQVKVRYFKLYYLFMDVIEHTHSVEISAFFCHSDFT